LLLYDEHYLMLNSFPDTDFTSNGLLVESAGLAGWVDGMEGPGMRLGPAGAVGVFGGAAGMFCGAGVTFCSGAGMYPNSSAIFLACTTRASAPCLAAQANISRI
jgi:hypothetical protein